MTRAQSRLPHIVTHEVKILTTQSTVSWPVSFWLFFARQTKVQSEPHGSLCTFTALNSNWIVTFHQQLKIEDVFLWDVIAVERDFHFSLNRVFDIAWDLNRNTLKLNTNFTSIKFSKSNRKRKLQSKQTSKQMKIRKFDRSKVEQPRVIFNLR